MNITPEILQAYRDMVRAKLLLWKASEKLEQITGLQIDLPASAAFISQCALIDDIERVDESISARDTQIFLSLFQS